MKRPNPEVRIDEAPAEIPPTSPDEAGDLALVAGTDPAPDCAGAEVPLVLPEEAGTGELALVTGTDPAPDGAMAEAPPASPPPTLRARALRAFDRAAMACACAARVVLRRGPLFAALAAAPVLFAWPLLPSLRPALTDNAALHRLERLGLLGAMVISALALGGALLLTARRHRADGPGASALAATRLQDRLLPLLVLPFLPPLVLTSQETTRPIFTLALILLAAATTVFAVYRAPPAPRLAALLAPDTAFSRITPPSALLLLAAGYAVVFSLLSVGLHHALATAVFDLAIYDNIFWQSAHGNPLGTTFVKGGNHIAAHFDPLLVLLSPLYLLAPRAETILVLQSVWLASGAIPVFLIARRHLGSPWAGLALAVVWTLYPALHGVNLYDFHSLALIAPLVPWALHHAECGHAKRYAVLLALLLFAREDVSLLVCFLGLHLLLSGRQRVGLATIAAAVIWLAFAKLVVMPDPGLLMKDSATSYGYAHYFRDLIPRSLGSFGLISTLLANPIYALGTLLKDEKVLFFARLFVPLLFLPFIAPRGRILLVYGLAFCLLASRSAVFSIHYQYSVLIFPMAIALVPPALARLRDGRLAAFFGLDGPRLARALLAGVVVSTALVSLEYGALVPNESFKGGPGRFVRKATPEMQARYEVVKKAVAMIPPDASVNATDRLAPHISNRRKAWGFPGPKGDYVLADLKDQRARKEVDQLRKSGAVEVLLEEEQIVLLRRLAEPAREPGAALLQRLVEPAEGRGSEPAREPGAALLQRLVDPAERRGSAPSRSRGSDPRQLVEPAEGRGLAPVGEPGRELQEQARPDVTAPWPFR